jgi:hypothetical protein
VVFVDLDADAATRLDRCVTALATVPEAAAVYISPELREWMDNLRASESSEGNTPTT